MKAVIITDEDYRTGLFQKLSEKINNLLNGKGFETEFFSIGKDDLAFCMGCFDCWIKKPGECIVNDMMAKINRSFVNSDSVVYLCPVIFGQFSANIKNALDRWLPNMLPFFETRPDGSTMHPSRYEKHPKLVFIGYSDDLSQDDERLFTDIIKKHRNNVEALVYRGSDDLLVETFKDTDMGIRERYL